MEKMWISPAEKWWKLLTERDVVVYFYFPIVSSDEWSGSRIGIHFVLIRGSVLSMGRNNCFGATTVRVRVHAKCRLYKEPFLPTDEVVEMDFRSIVGIDHRGVMLLP